MQPIKRRLYRLGSLVGLMSMLMLAGCSAGTRLAYNHLDTLVLWELSDYVDLEPAQKSAFQTQFRALWDWHRRSQLPAYARDFRAMAAAVEQGPLALEKIERFASRIEDHGTMLGEHVNDRLAPLLPMLSDAQVRHLAAQQRKTIENEERKHADETPDERRKRYLHGIDKRFERWIGELNATQKQAADRAWTDNLPVLPSAAERRETRLASAQAFVDLLQTRRAPDFEMRLKNFWTRDEELPRKASAPIRAQAAAEARQRQFVIELLMALDEGQRRKLRTQLRTLADDCDALAAQGPASEAASRS